MKEAENKYCLFSGFYLLKREMCCSGACAVPFLCHPTCVGAHDFSYGPPLTGSWPPLCHPIKKNPRIAPDVIANGANAVHLREALSFESYL